MKLTLIELLIVVACILVWMPGCATSYHAVRTDPTTGSHTEINVKSHREFPGGVSIHYNRDTGTFELTAGEVTTGHSPLEEAAAAILLQMPMMLQPMREE